MEDYQYIGGEARFYPWLPGHGALWVSPGEIVPFVTPPSDGQWVLVPPKTKAKEKLNG